MRTAALVALFAVACGACGDVDRVRDADPREDPRDMNVGAPVHPVAKPIPVLKTGAPYPIILVHGMGLSAHTGPLDYWWKIPDELRDAGERVFIAATDPLRMPSDRAKKLAAYVDEVLAKTGSAKVNLVGHSMGGIDARYLVSTLGYGDRVASITSIATPHTGSPVADVIIGAIPESNRGDVNRIISAMATLLEGNEQDVLATGLALSSASMASFNAANLDDKRVAYFSIVGVTTDDPLFLLHDKDFCDLPLVPTFEFLKSRGLENDGLVPVDSQRWGEVLETVQADHYNEVAQPLGLVGNAFDWKSTYRKLARTLHERGY